MARSATAKSELLIRGGLERAVCTARTGSEPSGPSRADLELPDEAASQLLTKHARGHFLLCAARDAERIAL